MGDIAQSWIEASEEGEPVYLSASEIASACRWHLVEVEDYRDEMSALDRDPSDAGHLATWLGY